MKATELVAYAKAALGSAYLWGSFGQTVTETFIQSKRTQYPSTYTASYVEKCRKHIGKRAFDCVGLIKAALWSGGVYTAKVSYNGVTDIDANAAYNKAAVKGVISVLPERPGLCLWCKGHIGVYTSGTGMPLRRVV